MNSPKLSPYTTPSFNAAIQCCTQQLVFVNQNNEIRKKQKKVIENRLTDLFDWKKDFVDVKK